MCRFYSNCQILPKVSPMWDLYYTKVPNLLGNHTSHVIRAISCLWNVIFNAFIDTHSHVSKYTIGSYVQAWWVSQVSMTNADKGYSVDHNTSLLLLRLPYAWRHSRIH